MKKLLITLIISTIIFLAGSITAQTPPTVEENVFNSFPNQEGISSFDLIIDDKGENDIGSADRPVSYITNSSANFRFGAEGSTNIEILDVDGNSSERQNLSTDYNNLENQPVQGFNQTLDQQKYVSKFEITNDYLKEVL